ncbi:MAG: MBL fold metallo-hydrolase [Candidatus Methanofastidiosia archaeon]
MVKIRYLGHACFAIKDGVTIICDPHDGYSVGLKKPDEKADLILISHHHFDHDKADIVRKESSKIIDSSGSHLCGEVNILGISSYHDEYGGRMRGSNTIYVFTLDDVTFCHLGDLGHRLTEEQLAQINDIDVLFIPVGGTYTIDARTASDVARSINPKIVIPMHYSLPGSTVGVGPVDDFLTGKKEVVTSRTDEYAVDKKSLPEQTCIVVMKYGK